MKKPTRARPAPALTPDPLFAPIVDAFAGQAGISVGKMLASLGLKVDGKVFAMVVKGRFVVKLPKDRVAALVAAGQGTYFDRGDGKPMKEWFTASATSKAKWLDLAKEAKAFVSR